MLQLVKNTQRTAVRRPGRQFHANIDKLILNLRHETELDPAAVENSQTDNEAGNEHRGSDIAELDRPGDPAAVVPISQGDNALFNFLLHRGEPAQLFPMTQVTQVGGQNEERLDQRNSQCQRDHNRQLPGDLRVFTA